MEAIDKKIIRSEAAVAALVFGAISGGCTFLDPVIANSNVTWVSSIIAIVKLVGLIWLMRMYMIRMKENYDGVGSRELRQYGTWIALFSAIITAACSYISVAYAFPDFYKQAIDTLWEQLSTMMDSNTASIMGVYENNFALISLGSTFVWCFLYGWVLSSILAPRCAPKSIFDESDDE